MNFEASHGGFAGKSLIEKIEDKARGAISVYENLESKDYETREYGRVEGLCAALGILRQTSTKHELGALQDG